MAARSKFPTGRAAAPVSVWSFRFAGAAGKDAGECRLKRPCPQSTPARPKATVLVIDDEAGYPRRPGTAAHHRKATPSTWRQNGTEGLRKLETARLRPGAARPDDAGPLRHGGAARSPRARPRNAHLHDHRLRLGGSRGQRPETRRQRLFLQALGQRKADHRDRPHDRAAGASNTKTRTSSAPSSSATASPTSSARASAWCACWTWWRRWRPAAPPF